MHMSSIDFASLLLRLALGGMIVLHGLNKMKSKQSLNGTGQWFASIGMRQPQKQALLAAVTETLSGLFILLGLFTPLACAALISTMIVAIVVSHRKSGFSFLMKDRVGNTVALLAWPHWRWPQWDLVNTQLIMLSTYSIPAGSHSLCVQQ